MAKQLYDYWFVQFDFPNEDGKPYKSSGGTMVWNEKLKREIPQGWSNGVLSDVANITMGNHLMALLTMKMVKALFSIKVVQILDFVFQTFDNTQHHQADTQIRAIFL